MGSLGLWCIHQRCRLAAINPPPTASWALRKLCKVKKQLHMFLNKDSYVIKDAYKEFIGTAQSVRWSRMVWLRASIPKHRYIFWLAMLGKLKIRDRLKIMGVLDDESCPMCHVSKESIEHLFFGCKFSSYCLSLLLAWLGIRLCMRKLSTIYLDSWKVSKPKKQLAIASICSLVY